MPRARYAIPAPREARGHLLTRGAQDGMMTVDGSAYCRMRGHPMNRELLSPAERAFVDRVDAYWDGLLVVVVEDGAGFSWHPCESCGSPLGGDREHVHWVRVGTDERGTGTVCVDCAMYIANGEIPPDLELR